MDRNLIYALIMSVVIVVAFSAYQQYAYPPRPGETGDPRRRHQAQTSNQASGSRKDHQQTGRTAQ